jgi:tight adherence protein B
MDRLVERFRYGAKVRTRLEHADLRMRPSEFLSICFAILIVAALVGLLFKGTLGMLGGSLVGLVGPWVFLAQKIKRRRNKFLEQLADLAQMMGNSMRAGFSILQSMELVATEASQPGSYEFERVVTEVKLGLPLDTALEHLLERMPGEDLNLMVVAINVQRQIGGNLSEILAVISQTIRDRVRFQRDLKAMTAQARYSSYIITALPVAVGIVINLMDKPYESYLYTSLLGHFMIGGSIVMLASGYFILRKIANIEV